MDNPTGKQGNRAFRSPGYNRGIIRGTRGAAIAAAALAVFLLVPLFVLAYNIAFLTPTRYNPHIR